jgi:citrate lyase beta subunit
MTIPTTISKVSAEVAAKAVQTAVSIEKFEEYRRINGKADETMKRDIRALKQVARYSTLRIQKKLKNG